MIAVDFFRRSGYGGVAPSLAHPRPARHAPWSHPAPSLSRGSEGDDEFDRPRPERPPEPALTRQHANTSTGSRTLQPQHNSSLGPQPAAPLRSHGRCRTLPETPASPSARCPRPPPAMVPNFDSGSRTPGPYPWTMAMQRGRSRPQRCNGSGPQLPAGYGRPSQTRQAIRCRLDAAIELTHRQQDVPGPQPLPP